MSIHAWLSVAVTAACIVSMIFSRLGPELILFGGMIALMLSGVLDAEQALAGFSNEGMFTVALMYILVAGIRETGGIEVIIRHVLGRPKNLLGAQLRLMLPVFGLSTMLNNTAVVAIFLPAVLTWARRIGLPASKLLIPLSYATILGGTVTLIGTSTNIVVNGLLIASDPGLAMGMFDITWVGLPIGLLGLAYIVCFSRYFLPNRASAAESFENPKEYTIEMEVEANGPLVNQSISEAGLRHLGGVYLVEIDRDGNAIAAVGTGEKLKAHDRLVFAGSTSTVIDLQQIKGLKPSEHHRSSLAESYPERRIVEAVVSKECALVGQTLRDGRFRTTYGAAVLAVCRDGQRLDGNLGNICLQPADILLMEARPAFIERHRQSRDFLLISEVEGPRAPAAREGLAGLGHPHWRHSIGDDANHEPLGSRHGGRFPERFYALLLDQRHI